MPVDEKAFEDFIKKAHDKKYAKKKTRKQAFDDFAKWKEGKLESLSNTKADENRALLRPSFHIAENHQLRRVPGVASQ